MAVFIYYSFKVQSPCNNLSPHWLWKAVHLAQYNASVFYLGIFLCAVLPCELWLDQKWKCSAWGSCCAYFRSLLAASQGSLWACVCRKPAEKTSMCFLLDAGRQHGMMVRLCLHCVSACVSLVPLKCLSPLLATQLFVLSTFAFG